MFQGVYTAIITPFQKGRVDEKKLEELVALQVEAGVQGVMAGGTTGESLFLTGEEQTRIFEICAHVCKGKAQLIASTGTLSAENTISLTHQAQKAGANAAIVITPWYVKPSQESLYHYYKEVSEGVKLPFIIYNNPTRTGVDISFETLVKLMTFNNIQGYKDSSSCLQRTSKLKCQLGDRLSLLAGNDDPFAAYLGMGGDGGILAAANVVPDICVTLMTAWTEGELPLFKTTWKKIFPLLSALALETNPAPIKYAMMLVHGISAEMRLSFSLVQPSTQRAIEEALEGLGLWKRLDFVRSQ